MAIPTGRRGIASTLVACALATLAGTAACGSGGPEPLGDPLARTSDAPPEPPGAPPPGTDPAPPTTPPPIGEATPERPGASVRWTRTLDADAQAVQIASAGDGSVVAVTRGPPEASGRLTIQRVDADGAVLWTISRVPACVVTLAPLGTSGAGEVFFAARAWCDDPLPGLWPVPLGRGALVVLGQDGTFRRRIPVGFSWALAAAGPAGDVFAGEDREDTGALTFRKRSASGSVLWEKTRFMGTKASLELAPVADGGTYLSRDERVTRLGADGTETWTRSVAARGRWLAALDDGAVALAGEAQFGSEWDGQRVGWPPPDAVVVLEADGTPRSARLLPGVDVSGVVALPGGGVALAADADGDGCGDVVALGPRLEERWTRRLPACGMFSSAGAAASDPAAGTLALALVERSTTRSARAVLVSVDPSGGSGE